MCSSVGEPMRSNGGLPEKARARSDRRAGRGFPRTTLLRQTRTVKAARWDEAWISAGSPGGSNGVGQLGVPGRRSAFVIARRRRPGADLFHPGAGREHGNARQHHQGRDRLDRFAFAEPDGALAGEEPQDPGEPCLLGGVAAEALAILGGIRGLAEAIRRALLMGISPAVASSASQARASRCPAPRTRRLRTISRLPWRRCESIWPAFPIPAGCGRWSDSGASRVGPIAVVRPHVRFLLNCRRGASSSEVWLFRPATAPAIAGTC